MTDHQPRLDAWDKCSGLVHWEDPEGSGREGGGRGGSDWGIHVNPWLIHVNVWPKPLQYCKVISLQLIKINGGKKVSECVQVKTLTVITPGEKWERWETDSHFSFDTCFSAKYFFLNIFPYLFIYLDVLGLSCSVQALCCFSLVVTRGLNSCGTWLLAPQPMES